MAHVPSDLLYAKSHEWLRFTAEDVAEIGISDFAQSSFGDIVVVNLPEEGAAVVAGENATDVESVKAVADIVSPVTGTISRVNAELESGPEAVNERPYEAWIFEVSGITEREALLDAEQYAAFCEQEA